MIYVGRDISVAKVHIDGLWEIRLRRSLHPSELEEYCVCHARLKGATLPEGRDVVWWALKKIR